MWWKEPVTSIRGIGNKKAADLAALNIYTVGDLLEHYPRQDSYTDFSKVKNIGELATDGSKQLFKATVYQVKDGFNGRRRYTVVTVRDETGYANVYFFMGQRFMARKYKPDTTLLITGRIKGGRAAKMVSEATCIVIENDFEQALGILPNYHLAGNLTQKIYRRGLRLLLLRRSRSFPKACQQVLLRSAICQTG